jgi:D-alanine-D-alanine ligase
MKRKFKVLALFDAIAPTALDQDLSAELQTPDWKTEAHVLAALRELGHETNYLALFDNLDLLRQKLAAFQPDIVFNLADQFRNNRAFDQNIVSVLEMDGTPFTGCGSVPLTLCKHKGISKKILGYHRIHVPGFVMIPRGRRRMPTRGLKFPLLVKPLKEESSLGISQASLVHDAAQLAERVRFIHEKFDNDVIAEEYIDGRELYVGVLGAARLQVFPTRELVFREVPPDEPKIATYKAKWDEEYRKRWGLENQFAEELDPLLVRKIEHTCKRIHRLLLIDGYARLDLRLTPAGDLYFIEANPNPMLAADEDFAQSAARAGLAFPQLIQRILRLGLSTNRE